MSEASFTSEKQEIRLVKGSAADLQAWAMEQPVTGRCCFCPELEFKGTVQEVMSLAREHRLERHPETRNRKRRRVASPAVRMSFAQKLTVEEAEVVEHNRRQRMHLLGID